VKCSEENDRRKEETEPKTSVSLYFHCLSYCFDTFHYGKFIKICKLPSLFPGRRAKITENKMLGKLLVTFLVVQSINNIDNVNGLIEDVIDVLHLAREVIKTVSSTWELAEQTGVTNEIDLPFMQRKEKKIISKMAELTHEFRNAEMNVIDFDCFE
jgi:hypothetical protein